MIVSTALDITTLVGDAAHTHAGWSDVAGR